MSEKNTQHAHAHKPSADAATPMSAMFGMWRTEALKIADESEKAVERSFVEMKRATVEGTRLWESQLELQTAMTRAAFDGVRRMWSF